ncbi:hypothetical protein BH10ACT11_BH10ACT11_03190 [soil metagenome]
MSDPTFWQQHGDEVSAAITMVVAILIAFIVDRLVIGKGTRYAERVSESGVSRAAKTRLGVVRRLVFVSIIVIGAALALSQFTKVEKLATGILASSAVLGIVLGIAARQVLANPLAGILMAVTQPIRIGDSITLDDETGRVDDITLAYTYIDPGDGRLMIVPNEHVVTSVIFNRSTGDRNAPSAASIWVPPGADLQAVRKALAPLEASGIEIAEITHEGVRIVVHGPRVPDSTKAPGEESALRERSHQLLVKAGIFQPPGA